MNINELTPVKKSVMLAGLIPEWEVVLVWSWGDAWMVRVKDTEETLLTINMARSGLSLYSVDDRGNPLFMPLAWRVLNWADKTLNRITYRLPMTYGDVFQLWWEESTVFDMPPAEAQVAWLDKVLQLAIEAGLVQL